MYVKNIYKLIMYILIYIFVQGPSSSSHMPTAAAVAAAAATAKIQAMDAVATNAVLGLSKLSSQLGAQTAVLPGLQQLPTTLGITPAVPAATIPPPGIAIPQQIRAAVPIIPGNLLLLFSMNFFFIYSSNQ